LYWGKLCNGLCKTIPGRHGMARYSCNKYVASDTVIPFIIVRQRTPLISASFHMGTMH
jgi:hypothetical protein